MEKKTNDVLAAMKDYDEAKMAFKCVDDAAIVVGETTITADKHMKERIRYVVRENYRNACEAYHKALEALEEAIWEEYMNSFTS